MIRYQLWKISRRARPDAAFLSRLQQRLHSANRMHPHASVNSLRMRTDAYSLRMAGALGALVLSLSLGTSAYAYTSDDVLPESPLYPLRQAVEVLEKKAAASPKARQTVEQKLLQRRVKEIVVMRSRALPVKPAQAVKIRKELERMETGTEQEGVKEAEALVGVLERRQKTKDNVEKDRLDRESDEHLKKIERRVRRLRQESRENREKIEADER